MADDENCGSVHEDVFDLAEFGACPRPFKVSGFDPESMAVTVLTRQPAREAVEGPTRLGQRTSRCSQMHRRKR